MERMVWWNGNLRRQVNKKGGGGKTFYYTLQGNSITREEVKEESIVSSTHTFTKVEDRRCNNPKWVEKKERDDDEMKNDDGVTTTKNWRISSYLPNNIIRKEEVQGITSFLTSYQTAE